MRKQILIALASALLAGAPFALAQYIPRGGSGGGGGSSNCILNSSPSDVLFNNSGTCAGNAGLTYDGSSTVSIGTTSDGTIQSTGSNNIVILTPDGTTPGAAILQGGVATSGTGNAGGNADVFGGAAVGAGNSGGTAFATGGSGSSGASGGNVVLDAGTGATAGSILLGPSVGGVLVGPSPSGGDEGIGTVNASAGFWADGNFLGNASAVSTQFVPLVEVFPNDTSGTAAGKIVKINSSGKVLTVGTADTTDGIGICVASLPNSTQCSTTGNASIAYAGQVNCQFDGSTTAGDWVIISTSSAGKCSDAGATAPTSVEAIGRVLASNVGAGTYAVTLNPFITGAVANNKKVNTCGFTLTGDVTTSAGSCATTLTKTVLDPTQLLFSPPNTVAYFDPQPSGLIDITNNFSSTGSFTTTTTGTAPFTVSGNVGTIATTGAATSHNQITADTTITAPQTFVSIHVNSMSGGTGFNQVKVGIAHDGANFVSAYYDSVNHAVAVLLAVSGTGFGNTASLTLTPPFDLGFSLVGNSAVAWYRNSATGNIWTYGAGQATQSHLNFSTTSLSGWQTFFEVANGGGNITDQVSNLQGGRFGGVGIRDMKVVRNPDGTTYFPGSNQIYFTATASDPSGMQPVAGTGGSYQGVFSLNMNTLAITETGVIASSRTGNGVAGIYLDQAGQIIYHSNGDREVLESGWGAPSGVAHPVNMWYKYVTNGSQGDVLTTNLSVLSGQTQLSLPLGASGQGAYDGAMAFDSANNRYLMGYVISNDATFTTAAPTSIFYPALASASSPTGTWTLIGADSSLCCNWEGTGIFNANGVIYETAAGPQFNTANTNIAVSNSSRIYDESFTFLGSVKGATLDPTNTTVPHPEIFQAPDGVHIGLLSWTGTKFQPTNNSWTWGQPNLQLSPAFK